MNQNFLLQLPTSFDDFLQGLPPVQINKFVLNSQLSSNEPEKRNQYRPQQTNKPLNDLNININSFPKQANKTSNQQQFIFSQDKNQQNQQNIEQLSGISSLSSIRSGEDIENQFQGGLLSKVKNENIGKNEGNFKIDGYNQNEGELFPIEKVSYQDDNDDQDIQLFECLNKMQIKAEQISQNKLEQDLDLKDMSSIFDQKSLEQCVKNQCKNYWQPTDQQPHPQAGYGQFLKEMMRMAEDVEFGDSEYDIWVGDQEEYGKYLVVEEDNNKDINESTKNDQLKQVLLKQQKIDFDDQYVIEFTIENYKNQQLNGLQINDNKYSQGKYQQNMLQLNKKQNEEESDQSKSNKIYSISSTKDKIVNLQQLQQQQYKSLIFEYPLSFVLQT